MQISFNKPFFDQSEGRAVLAAIKNHRLTGDSFYGPKLGRLMQNKLDVKYVLPTPSGTAALELAMMCLDLKNYEEVILPSFNFPSGAISILRAGARPVFADIDRKTFCINPKSIEKAITPKTKAIMVVHYAGHTCDMGPVLKLAKKYNCRVIEDAAHAIGAKYKGRQLGTIGDIGCYSFHGTKNIVTGEGGAFVTNDKEIFEKAEIIREKGTNRQAFMRGEVSKYSLISIGSSYLLADVLSALAIAQMEKLEKITSLRKKHADYLLIKLKDLKSRIGLPVVRSYADPNWHIFALLVAPEKRTKFIKFLKDSGIEASSHYVPLHSSPLGKKLGWDKSSLPDTDFVSESIVRLPIYPSLTKRELDYISLKVHDAARYL